RAGAAPTLITERTRLRRRARGSGPSVLHQPLQRPGVEEGRRAHDAPVLEHQVPRVAVAVGATEAAGATPSHSTATASPCASTCLTSGAIGVARRAPIGATACSRKACREP